VVKMAFDPSSINLAPSSEMIATILRWLSILLWVAIFGVIGFFLMKWMRFRIRAEIFEIRGSALVKTRNTALREIIKDNVTKYEVRNIIGLFSRKRREFYYNTDECYKIPTTKGYKFYLLRMGFNAYNPMQLNVYQNKIEEIRNQLKAATLEPGNPSTKEEQKKKKQVLKDTISGLRERIKKDKDVNKSIYTYVPIDMANTTATEFEPIPQNLLPVLARSVVETNQIYSTQKWWEPYMLPISIFAICIVQIIVMGWMFDKVGDVGGTCEAAESKITQAITQRLK